MYPTASYVFGDIPNFKHTNNLESCKSPIHALEFSLDGKYIASGDDNYILMVCGIVFLLQWKEIRRYKTGDMICALAWHPTVPGALVVGSANGDLNKICLSTEPKQVCLFIQCLPVLIYILNGQKDFTSTSPSHHQWCQHEQAQEKEPMPTMGGNSTQVGLTQ
ncbi:hypothetical protein L208DRAFT_1290739 [Tricholoma matsutake]|nr:hypothetical protein L208DRAFT_1290739 [Tricholoma matsutake 945]